ncbi:MAG: hypothetical protein K8R99_05410 [Actinomycetia bacterium]|nr:hypothetical protein [Actinomycetes bacterium]
MVRKIQADNLSGDRLEIVRHGYDPYQVQRLVSTLANELKALAAENDALRGRLNDAPVRARDANGGFIERRAKGQAPAAVLENAELRENLRWARAALDGLLGQLAGKPDPVTNQHEQSTR